MPDPQNNTIPPPPPGFVPVDNGPASDAAGIPPPPAGFVPVQGGGVSSGVAAPSFSDKLRAAAQVAENLVPGTGAVHELASKVGDWAAQKAQEGDQQNLSKASQTGQAPGLMRFMISPETGLRVLADTSHAVEGATGLKGAAVTAGTVLAPEVTVPYLVGSGIRNGVQGWGDLKNPDVLQNELNSAAQVVGAAAASPEAIKRPAAGIDSIRASVKNAGRSTLEEALEDFKSAIPPSKSARYEDNDLRASRPYLEAEHAAKPIEDVDGVREAADNSIGKIEDHIDGYIQSHPNEVITTSPLGRVWSALKNSVNNQDMELGLKSLEPYKLGWERSDGAGGFTKDPPLTLEEADKIRLRMNNENKAILKKNNYDVYTARETDPTFAAREAAAEALRDGIYDKLEELGYKGVRQLRLDEGSLIKVRNAAENAKFKNDQQVKGTGKTTAARVGANVGIRVAGAGAGGVLGSFFGPAGTAGGMAAGEMAAAPLANRITKTQPLTRGDLVQKSLRDAGTKPAVATPAAPLNYEQLAKVAIPQGFVRIQDSRGGVHDVPQESVEGLQQRDPGLKIMESK